MNLEQLLVSKIGSAHGLCEQLSVALQFSSLIPEDKKKAAHRLANSTTKSVKDYVENFRGGLPSSTLNSTKYSFNVFLVPRVVGKKDLADVAVTFVKVDEANQDELQRLERLNVLIKEKHIPIANLGLHKPSQVVPLVNAKLPHRFTTNAHSRAWRHFRVRPSAGASKPEETAGQYCVYDKAHNDYLYTDAWIAKLVAEMSDPAGFEVVAGFTPVAK